MSTTDDLMCTCKHAFSQHDDQGVCHAVTPPTGGLRFSRQCMCGDPITPEGKVTTVGGLKVALEGMPDDMVLRIQTPDDWMVFTGLSLSRGRSTLFLDAES